MLSESLPPPVPTAAPRASFREIWSIRAALWFLHVTIVVAATSLTPEGYYFQLGEYTGPALLFSSVILWWFLLSAETRRAFRIFCVLAVGQAGLVALVALHFRAEDRVLRPIVAEIGMKRNQWASEMGQFRMDPLFDMISGKRRLSVEELRELQTRARAGNAKISEMQSEVIRLVAEEERRIGAVSSGAARDFRRGYESSRPASEEQMKVLQDYFAANDQLAEFLIGRQGQYSQTPGGLVFTRGGDAEAFNKQFDAIAHLEEQINSFAGQHTPNR